jgi:hypothetical protein
MLAVWYVALHDLDANGHAVTTLGPSRFRTKAGNDYDVVEPVEPVLTDQRSEVIGK